MKNPDAIVIGAGVVGACTALALSNAGLKVLVIDRGPVASGTTVAGLPAIIPTVTGRAWIMGEATWVLDPTDPFPNGFIA
jgi:glycine/D-amino acid oxidase-like deaminating enzyme